MVVKFYSEMSAAYTVSQCMFTGNAVKRATEALVKSAQQVKEREDEANVQVNKRMVGGVAQVCIRNILQAYLY